MISRIRPLAASILLLAGTLIGCGNDSSAADPLRNDDASASEGSVSRDAGDDSLLVTPALPAFSLQPQGTLDDQGYVATLVDVRAAAHEGYDRIVLEFSDRVPGWRVRYLDEQPRACGSGHAVELGTAQVIEVDLRPAAAHNDEGRPTLRSRTIEPRLDRLQTARITCDFEAIVAWVLGVSGREPFRAFTLQGPPRLVVDVRH